MVSNSVPFKAMILAAGRGERMRPLTDTKPKPLLQAGGKSLIEYQLIRLAEAGFTEIVINHAYLGEMIELALGNGARYGVSIQYSHEPLVLETAGGIANAMPLLTNTVQDQPFLVVNADVYSEIDYAALLPVMQRIQLHPEESLAHLLLVDNPAHHTDGDFALEGLNIQLDGENKLTFSGVGVYQPALFCDVLPKKPAKLAPLFRHAIKQQKLTGEYFQGVWIDVGTPDRLSFLDNMLVNR
ncbi:MAG: nucleotidyltransferase family protein [Nitrosomonas sp.]|nr:nucleotidyltransferase family protein [Nitrosomonas sp.]